MNIIDKPNWLQILQGWAILWVVIGNTYLDPVEMGPEWVTILLRTAYSFHLPLLMFVFGCIFYNTFMLSDDNAQQSKAIIKSNLMALAIPFAIFTVVAIVAKAVLSNTAYSYDMLMSDVIRGFLLPGEHPISPLWFVMVLMWLYAMQRLWMYIFQKEWLIWTIAVVLLILHLIVIPIEFLCIKWLGYFAVYFYLGMMIMKYGILNKLSGMTGLYVFVGGYLLYMLGADVDKTLTEVGGIVFSIGVVLILSNTFPKTFSSFRDYYFQILLMGYFAQMLFRIIYPYLPIPYFVGYLVCLAVGIYIPVLITRLIHTINAIELQVCIGESEMATSA